MVQKALLLKVSYRFNVIPMKTLVTFLTETERNPGIHIKPNRLQIAKAIQNRRATPDLKLYSSHSNKSSMILEKKQTCTPMEYSRGLKNKLMKLLLPNFQQTPKTL